MPSFIISDFKTGFENDKEPFLLPQDAFPLLEDAYCWRGRVLNKFGFNLFDGGQLNSRLRIKVGTTAATPFTVTLPGTFPLLAAGPERFSGRQMFSIGDIILTSNQTGAGVQPLISTDATYTGTMDNTTGALSIAHPAIVATDVYYYPGFPVVGLDQIETTILNFEDTAAFDLQFSYHRVGTGWDILGTIPNNIGSALWTGTSSDLFWTQNYYGVLWTTNNIEGNHGLTLTDISQAAAAVVTTTIAAHDLAIGDIVFFNEVLGMTEINGLTGTITGVPAANQFTVNINSAAFGAYTGGGIGFVTTRTVTGDGIKYYDYTTTTQWRNFSPPLSSATTPDYLFGALIIVPFKDRLIAFNTVERPYTAGGQRYAQRARWSQNGTPFYATTNVYTAGVPNPGYSWASGTNDNGLGGYIDATTSQQITGVEFIKDRLIVFFERSTWEFVATNNDLLPFVWQRINSELGCESTFSTVGFDDGTFAVGQRGIHTANPNGVERIDVKIPNKTFQINNSNNGAKRVYSIRDFSRELIMTTYPLFGETQYFPNKVLVYNYINNSFAEFNDSFTCYDYHQKTSSVTWDTLPYNSWDEWDVPWDNGISQTAYPLVIAGNQQGWTFLFEDTTTGDASLMVTDVVVATRVLTVPDHNLKNQDFIVLANMNGLTIDGGNIVQIDNVSRNTFRISRTITDAGAGYLGGGTVELLSNFRIRSKEFMLFAEQDKASFVNGFHFLTSKTSDGEYQLNIYQDGNTTENIFPLMGDSTVYTKPETINAFLNNQSNIWHKVQRPLNCVSFQLEFTLNTSQLIDLTIQQQPFELHAIQINAEPVGRL